jgi:hypothetical protein
VDAEGGWDGIVELTKRASKAPEAIGIALAESDQTAYEEQLIALIDADDQPMLALAWGYVVERFRRAGWSWLERAIRTRKDGEPRHLARLLLASFDHPRDWQKAQSLGPDVEREYWLGFRTSGLGHDYAYLTETVNSLINVGRAVSAAELVAMYSNNPAAANVDLASTAADVLDALAHQPTRGERIRIEQYSLNEIFQLLEKHKDSVGITRVAQLELTYLPALGFEPSIPTLHEALSQNPTFFLEVVSIAYGPRTKVAQGASEEIPEEDAEAQESAAIRVYRLLKSWRIPPGRAAGETLNKAKLNAWLDEVLPLLRTAGHLEGGELHIGECLASTPPDPDGTWPPRVVRGVLERLQSSRIEQGLESGVISRRGVTTRALESGGAQERNLADKYRADAETLAVRWPRSAAVLRGLAGTYEHLGRAHETDAEGWRQGRP